MKDTIRVLAFSLVASAAPVGAVGAAPEPASPGAAAKASVPKASVQKDGGPGAAKKADSKAKADGKAKGTSGATAAAGLVRLQGELTCAKCGLHEASACQSVLVVKEGGQDVKYYLAKNAVAEAEHEKVCGGSVAATVTGTVSDEGGHKVVTAATVTVK